MGRKTGAKMDDRLVMDDPKPCPVCGRKPQVEKCEPWGGPGAAPWYVGCYDPGIKEHFRGVNGDNKLDAIKRWNQEI